MPGRKGDSVIARAQARDSRAVLKRRLPELKQLFEGDPRVLGVWLFGSQADGTATPQSDIDLAVLFDRELTWDEQMGFEVAVCEILRTDDVDVVDLRRVKLPLRAYAVTGKVLYERDYAGVSDFIERTLIEYYDYAPFLQRYDQDFFAGLRKDYARFKSRPPKRRSRTYRRKPIKT